MADIKIKNLSLQKVFINSALFVKQNKKSMMWFTLANFMLLILGMEIIRPLASFLPPQFSLGGIGLDIIGNIIFLIWCVSFYIFWCVFFRYYYHRKPYFMLQRMCESLVPSTKILFMTFIFATLLIILPYFPLFLGLPLDLIDDYTFFLYDYMQEGKSLDLLLNIILILVSPIILYRPFMAWIASVIGRSGLLKTALQKTRGNYWKFVAIIAVFNFSFVLIGQIVSLLHLPNVIFWLLASPLMIFFNVVVAKSYDFFFLKLKIKLFN